MPNLLLLQAHTKQQAAACRYFLLKYLALYNLKPPAHTAVVIHTNQPVAFEGFTSFFPSFQMPDAAESVSKTDLLHQALSQATANVLYCDATTYPLQPLEPLFADIEKGAVYLHAPHRHKESELEAAFRGHATMRDKTATAVATPASRINVWHTAVVGISARNKEQVATLRGKEAGIQNSLALDYAYTTAFSEGGKIKSAAKYIFDYGGFNEFGQLLETFFTKAEEESIPNQVKMVHHLEAAAIQQQKEQYTQQPLFKKWLQIITGKRWSIQQYINKL